jgi:hypothetical protein
MGFPVMVRYKIAQQQSALHIAMVKVQQQHKEYQNAKYHAATNLQ